MDPVPSREIADMTGAAALRERTASWSSTRRGRARIFGMTGGDEPRGQFRVAASSRPSSSAEIAHAEREGESSSYYARWLLAFERLLADKGLLDADALAERTHDFETGRRDDVF